MSIKEKLLASAQKNLQKGQVAKAIKDYQQIIALDPKDIRNRQKLAELLCRSGMNAEALDEYAAVAAYYGDNGFYLKAIAVYKQMQKLDPELVNVYHRLAEYNVKQGLIGNALAEYRNLLSLFERKKLHSDAIGVLQKMLELEPDNLNIQIKIAEVYVQAGLRGKAREELTQVLTHLRDARDFSRLFRLYDLFLPLFPGDREIRGGYAEALVFRGDWQKGLQLLKELLQDNPDDNRLHGVLAQAYRAGEDYENERLTYHHLLKQAPGDLALRAGYIRACIDGGEHNRALDELEEWKEAFLDAGQITVLRIFYEELREFLPGNENIRQGLALVDEQSDDDGFLTDRRGADSLLTDAACLPEDVPAPRVAESLTEPVCQESPSALAASIELSAEVVGMDEPPAEAEEIPLEFLEAAVATRVDSDQSAEQLTVLSQPSPVLPADEEAPVMPPDASPAIHLDEMAEAMEFELELVLDPLLEPTADLDVSPVAAADGATAGNCPEADAEDSLEELEELVELEAIEEYEESGELTTIELVDEPPDASAGFGSLAASPPLETAPAAFPEMEIAELLGGFDSGGDALPNLRDELDEAEFYLQQGLLDDAERVCRQILAIDEKCSVAREKLAEIVARQRTAAGAKAFGSSPAATDPRCGTVSAVAGKGAAPATDEAKDQQEGFDSFRIGIDTPVDSEDAETHYNLGIAYKEMGLLDEAVAEFDKSLKNPERLVDSLVLKGSCLFMKGDFEQAEKVFKSGLGCSNLNADERLTLYYEMGLLYEAWGRPLEALDSFQLVADADLFFRSVGEKIEDLRKNLGLDVNSGNDKPGAGSNRGRVSYI